MLRFKGDSPSGAQFSPAGVAETARFGVEDVDVVSDGEGESGVAGAQAVVVFLPETEREHLLVEEPDRVDDLPVEHQAEAVEEWKTRKSARRDLAHQRRDLVDAPGGRNG